MNARRSEKERVHIRFEGHVQGVGFRYTTVRTAGRFEVTGFVQNNSDGSVTVVAEGSKQVVLNFLQAVRASSVGRYIHQEYEQWSPASGEFPDFRVEYGY
jgi:acylphosphatase